MKIISRGVVPQDRQFRKECNSCHTIFEFSRKDGDLQNDRNEIVLVVRCPVCTTACSVKY